MIYIEFVLPLQPPENRLCGVIFELTGGPQRTKLCDTVYGQNARVSYHGTSRLRTGGRHRDTHQKGGCKARFLGNKSYGR